MQSDLEIAALLYADQRTPDGFYTDAAPPAASYVATTHLKNSDLPSATGAVAVHELCTDDWSQALDWSETVAAHADTYADLVATDGNERYFEFGRVPRSQAGAYQRARVFKCAYIDRGSVDLRSSPASGPAGQVNRSPFTAADLRELSEYLWLFSTFNNFGNAVLRSGPADSVESSIAHALHVATLTRAAASGGCDRVEVVEWTHSADVATGELTRSRSVLWSFGSRQVGESPELCTP